MQRSLTPIDFLKLNFVLILFAVFCDPAALFSFIPEFISGHFQMLLWPPLIIVNLCYYAGVCAVNIDIAFGDEFYLSPKKIFSAAKRYWGVYLIAALIPFAAHFILSGILFYDVNIRVISGLSDLFVVGAVLFYLARQKKAVSRFSFFRSVTFFDVLCIVFSLGMRVVAEVSYLQTPQGDSRFIFCWILLGRLGYFLLLSVLLSIMGRSFWLSQKKADGGPEVYFVDPSCAGSFLGVVMNFTNIRSGVFSLIKSLTPDRYRVREFSRVFWRENMFCGNKLVAITCFTANAAEAYWIAKKFREKGSRVVIGGPHAMFLTDEALAFCDAVVLGDAENVWPEILDDYERGSLKRVYDGVGSNDAEQLHDKIMALPVDDIERLLQTGRGCKFFCDFCSVSAMTKGRVFNKSLDEIMGMVTKVAQKKKAVTFLDNNIYVNPGRAREFFSRLKSLNIRWTSSCSIDIAEHDNDLKLAKDSGCHTLLVGYEVTPDSAEAKKGGKFVYAQRYIELTKRIKQHGIRVKAHFIWGFDGQDWLYVIDLWRLAFRMMPTATLVLALTPFPGTEFFRKVFNADRVVNLNWEHYGGWNMVYAHPHYDHRVFNMMLPVVYAGFLLTTSSLGYFLLCCYLLTSLIF